MAAGLLNSGDEDLSSDNVKRHLSTRFVGQAFHYFPSVTSTMDVARALAVGGAPEGSVVLAEEQRQGRGRLGRAWLSPPGGNLTLSIILRPTLRELSRLTMVASLAVVQAIRQVATQEAAIKWPNDVLISGRKICGLLVDSQLQGEAVEWAVVGIGLNVNMEPAFFPEIADSATSLYRELGRPVERLPVLIALLASMEDYYVALRLGKPIQREWARRLETVGKSVVAREGNRVVEGVAEAVDDEGHLLVRRSDGTLVHLVAGEATLRRV